MFRIKVIGVGSVVWRQMCMCFGLPLLIAVFSTTCWGQFPNHWSADSRLYIGKILKHNPEILFDPPAMSYGFGLGLNFKTYGQKDWHEWQDYPEIGLVFSYFNLGNRDTIGYAYALRYNIAIDLINRDQWGVKFEFGAGFAWLDRPFNRMTNPINNAIGSSFNAFAQITFLAEYQFNRHLSAFGGLGLTHYSNGAAQLPNLGINVNNITIGIAYSPQPLSNADFIPSSSPKVIDRHFGLRLEHNIGYSEIRTNGGPRYPIKTYSLAGRYAFNKANRIFMGVTYEYNRGIFAFGSAVFAFNSEREAFWGASRLSIFAEDEFLFGNLGIALQAGFYIGDFSYLVPNSFYFKLSHRYYFRLLKNPAVRAFTGVTLKSHLAVAEHFALNLGLDF